MEDWDSLLSDMVRQNCIFVASCSVVAWDLLISFGEEVRYVWRCPSKITRYLFLFCRYWTVGYSIAYLIFGTQWTPQIPIQRRDCRTWFLVHTASIGLLYTGSQLTLIQKVFDLYGQSVLLATGLFILQCIQVTGILILSHHISSSLHFNAICNAIGTPNFTFSVPATVIFVQCIIWALILRKSWRFQPRIPQKWQRYLWTSDTHAKLSWGVAIAAITFNTTHSLARQRIAPVYIFTLPIVVVSVGTCRYILRIEKARVKRAGTIEIDDKQRGESKLYPMASQRAATRHIYPPQPSPTKSSPPIPRASPTQNFPTDARSRNLDAAVSNSPYLHGGPFYQVDRGSTATIATTNDSNSPQHTSDCSTRRTSSVPTTRSYSRSSVLSSDVSSLAGSRITYSEDTEITKGDGHSASDIEIGSLHSSSSVDSEELRRFYNDTWNVGPFVASGS